MPRNTNFDPITLKQELHELVRAGLSLNAAFSKKKLIFLFG